MKKSFLIIPIAVVMFSLIMPVMVLALDEPATKCILTELKLNDYTGIRCPTVVTGGVDCEFSEDAYDCAMCCTVNTILKATNWIFLGVVTVSAIMAIFGGYNILTAGGNAEQVTKGRDYIRNAIIGLAVALLANAIPAVVSNVLGLG